MTTTGVDVAAAGAWLIGQQVTSGATAGALPWTSGGGVFANTQGATAMGLLRTYKLTHDPVLLNAAIANGQCQISNCISNWTYPDGSHRFATHDPLFLDVLSTISGDPQYANFVSNNFWTPLANGTYGDPTNYTAATWADAVLTGRTNQGYPELAAWDLSKVAIAAHNAGHTAMAQAIMARVLASLNAANATNDTFDVIGLTGAIWASNMTGIALDPTTGTWASDDSTADLAASLLGFQAPGGGFVGSTAFAVTDANADAQTSGYAILALGTTDRAAYLSNMLTAASFLGTLQQPSGQILVYPGAATTAAGGVEAHGEATEAFAVQVGGVDRWVARTVAAADTGDCSIQASPCLTIAYAITQAVASNTIHIDSGTYAVADGTNLEIDSTLDGLQLVGQDPNNMPVITRQSGGFNQPLLVINGAQDVRVENIEFGMDQTYVAEGILASGNVTGLTITNNVFNNSRSSTAQESSYSYRNAIAINYTNNSQGLPRVNGSTVSIDGNTINGVADLVNGVFLRAGIQMDGGNGSITNNTVTTAVHDIEVRFATANASSSGTGVTIDGNHTFGRGLEVSSPNASTTQITVSNNDFNAPTGIDDTSVYPADFALAKLINNGANVATLVSNNNFIGHQGSFRGLLIENYPGVQLTGNTFSPATGATDFVSLVLSNKAITTVDPALAPLTFSITAKGNIFNGSTVAGAGTAVELLNDNDAADADSYGSLVFGGPGAGEANQFDGNHQWYFHLDDYNCDTVTTPCAFLDYAGAIGSTANTEVRPFTGDVAAADNAFAGTAPAAMTTTEFGALLARTFDTGVSPAVGMVDYGVGAPTVVYVDDDFSGSLGDPLSFGGNPGPGCGAAPAIFGFDAFDNIVEALNQVQSGGTVCVAAGTYVEGDTVAGNNLVITQPVSVYGAQAGVDARNRADAGASIIYPAVANPTLAYSGPSTDYQAIVYIGSDHVTLDGFVFDGDNPGLSPGIPMGSANPDVDGGIDATGSHIDISHNVVRNLVYSGISGFNYPATVPTGEGNVISYNWVHNIDAPSDWGIGIAVLWNYYADIHHNLLDDVRIGVQTNYFFKATANPSLDARIRDNEIHASATGIYDNYFTNPSSPFTLANNQVYANANPAQDGLWVGIVIQALHDDTTGIFLNNHIDGSALASSGTRDTAGYRVNLMDGTQAANTAINGGTVSHVDYGVLATDGAFYAGEMRDIVVTNVAFDDMTWGLYVEDTALAGSETMDYAPKVTVGTGNTFTNVTWQGALAGPQATIAYAAGATELTTVLVRAANGGHRAGEVDSHGNVRSVANAEINDGIDFAASGGTVTVEAGTYAENVVVDNGVTVEGPFVGTPGYDASRTGSGEALVQPADGIALTFDASGARVDGMTLAGDTSGDPTNNHAVSVFGDTQTNIALVNSRIVNVTNGSGLSAEPGASCIVDGFVISDNLFANISGGGAADGRGIRLGNGFCHVQILNNHFDTVHYAINANGGGGSVENLTISGNDIQNPSGTALVITNTTHTSVTDNTIASSSGGSGLFISDSMDDFIASCNTISVTGNGISTLDFFGGVANSGVKIFHNAISAATDVNNAMAQPLAIGSNWYGGGSATSNTSGGAVTIAPALAADPTSNPLCGDNSPAQLVAISGTPQSTDVNTAFAQPLVARVEDALGGAVIGANVSFSASPFINGASAALAPTTAVSDNNGIVSTTATANNQGGGPYNVYAFMPSAPSATPAAFSLSNDWLIGSITWQNLIATYNGSLHTPTAFVTEEPTTLCSTIPYGPNAGSYTVTATCVGVEYFATGTATAVINQAAGTVSFTPLSGPYGSVHSVTATLAENDANESCSAVSGVPAQSASQGSYLVSASCTSLNYSATGTATYQVTGSGVSVFPVTAAPVGVVTLVPQPDAPSKMSWYTWGSSGSASELVRAEFTISSSNAAPQAGDISAQWLDPSDSTWKPLPLTFDALTGTWSGLFGPATGFPPGAANSDFRAAFHNGGRYTIHVALVGASSGLTLATATPVVTEVAEIEVNGSGNTAGVIGVPVDTSYAVVNSGTAALSSGFFPTPPAPPAQPAPNDENVRGEFVIDGPQALAPASTNPCGSASCASPDVEVEFFDPMTGQYEHIYNLQSDGSGGLVGHFGALANGGAPMPAGYSATYLFRTTYSTYTGSYAVTSRVIGLDTGTVYAETAPQTVAIDPGVAASITMISGDAGVATVGGNAYDQGDLVVEVLDSGGNLVQGAAVVFNVLPNASGAGATWSAPALTDANGRTHISALSNNVAGAFQVDASLSNGASLATPFGLINNPDNAPGQVRLTLLSGNNQTAPVNGTYAMGLMALVTDAFGNPLQGVNVSFTAPGSGASVTPPSFTDASDASGIVDSGVLTANATAGGFTVSAAIGASQCTSGNCAVSYNLTNTAGSAANVTLTTSAANAVVGTSAAYPLTATVTDAGGNPVSGVSVTLVGPGSGAGVTPALATGISDAAGQVVHSFDANTVAGSFQVQAVVSGTSPSSVSLENLADVAASIEYVAGDAQSTPISSAFATDLTVRVVDQFGNAVADTAATSVSFSAPTSGASASVTSPAISGTGGLASTPATANGSAGSYTVVASFGASTVNFALTNTLGTATISNITWADNSAISIAYDGTANAATATVTGTTATPSFTYNGSATPPTASGSYQVIASVNDGNVQGSASAMLTITPAASGNTGISLTGGTFSYDGASHAATVANPNGVAYSLSYDTINGLAPTDPGTYTAVLTVTDPNYAAETLTASITILDDANIVLTVANAPAMGLVGANAPWTDMLQFDGYISNTGGPTSQLVHLELEVVRIDDGNNGGAPMTIDASDVLACVRDTPGWHMQDPANHHGCRYDSGGLFGFVSLYASQHADTENGRDSTVFRYPSTDQINQPDIPVPHQATPVLFQAIELAFKPGEYKVWARIVGSSNGHVYAQTMTTTTVPDAAISYAGPNSGQVEATLNAQSTLSNSGGPADGNVRVRVTLSDDGGAALAPGDVNAAYQVGSNFLPLIWTQSGNDLVTWFGPASGFPLPDGYHQTTSLQAVFHRQGNYHLSWDVLDAATASVLFTSSSEPMVIGANQVAFTLSNLVQVYDGSPKPVTVDPGVVPHTVIYEAKTGPSCPTTPVGANTTAPTNAGPYCVYVSADAPWSGNASGVLTVQKAPATVALDDTLDGTDDGVIHRTFDSNPQTVTATTNPASLGYSVTYDGGAAPTAAGSYVVVAAVTDPNYSGSVTGTLVIATSSGASITVDDDDGTVDGTIHRAWTGSGQAVGAITTPTGLGYDVTYVGSGATNYPLTATPPSAVGSYQVVATLNESGYQPITASATLEIEAVSASISLDGAVAGVITRSYDGNTQQVTATTVPAGLAYTVSYNGGPVPPVNAGSYPVTANITEPGHSGNVSGTLTIDKISGQVSFSNLSAVYDGNPHSATAVILQEPGNASACTLLYNSNLTPPTLAGTYTVDATCVGSNYTATGSASLNVAKRPLTISLSGTGTFAYDGNPHPATASIAGDFGGGTATAVVSYTPGGANAPVIDGIYQVQAMLDAASQANYTAAAATGVIEITAISETITLGNLNQTYDGSDHPVTVSIAPDAGLSYLLTYDGAAIAPTNAGSYTVVATITDPGYSGTTSGTLVVAKRPLTISLSGTGTFTYDTNAHAATASISGDFTGGSANVVVSYNPGGANAPVNVGTYQVQAALDAASQVNYSATPATGVIEIEAIAESITLGNLNQTYDGNLHPVSVTVSPDAGVAYTVTYDGSSTAPTNAGSYTVVATITEPGYSGTTSGTLVVAKRAVTITLGGTGTFNYDGNPHAATASIAGDFVGGTAAAVVTYNPGGANAPVNVGSYQVQAVLDAASQLNYSATPANGNIVIDPTPVTDVAVTLTDQRDYAQYGEVLTYLITVTNLGNQDLNDVAVDDVLPATLVPAGWSCLELDTAAHCDTTAGSGDLHTTIDLPGGTASIIILDTFVNNNQSLPTDQLVNSVTVTANGDTTPANDNASDTTQAVILRDGFEVGGDGAQVINRPARGGRAASASLTGDNSHVVALGDVWASQGGLVEVARLDSDSGDRIRIQAVHVGDHLLVRMLGQVAGQPRMSDWARVETGTKALIAGLVAGDTHSVLLLQGPQLDLQLHLTGANKIRLLAPRPTIH